jgi:hypothetical protein
MIRCRHLLQAFTAVLAGHAIVRRANALSVFDRTQSKGQSIAASYQLLPRGDLMACEAQPVDAGCRSVAAMV